MWWNQGKGREIFHQCAGYPDVMPSGNISKDVFPEESSRKRKNRGRHSQRQTVLLWGLFDIPTFQACLGVIFLGVLGISRAFIGTLQDKEEKVWGKTLFCY